MQWGSVERVNNLMHHSGVGRVVELMQRHCNGLGRVNKLMHDDAIFSPEGHILMPGYFGGLLEAPAFLKMKIVVPPSASSCDVRSWRSRPSS